MVGVPQLRNGKPNKVAAKDGELPSQSLLHLRIPIPNRFAGNPADPIYALMFESREQSCCECHFGVRLESKVYQIAKHSVIVPPEALLQTQR